jgi:hypothetical protein
MIPKQVICYRPHQTIATRPKPRVLVACYDWSHTHATVHSQGGELVSARLLCPSDPRVVREASFSRCVFVLRSVTLLPVDARKPRGSEAIMSVKITSAITLKKHSRYQRPDCARHNLKLVAQGAPHSTEMPSITRRKSDSDCVPTYE